MKISISEILYVAKTFLPFAVVSVILTVGLGVASKVFIKKFTTGTKQGFIYSYFINISGGGLIQTSIMISRFVYVCTLFLFAVEINFTVFLYLFVTGIILAIATLNVGRYLFDLAYSIILYLGLVATQVVQNYMFEIGLTLNIQIFYVILIVFVLLYQIIVSMYYTYLTLKKSRKSERQYS